MFIFVFVQFNAQWCVRNRWGYQLTSIDDYIQRGVSFCPMNIVSKFRIFENWYFRTDEISIISLEIWTFISFLRYNFAKIFEKLKSFLENAVIQKFSVSSTPKIGLFGPLSPFCHSPFGKSLPPIATLVSINIRAIMLKRSIFF